MRRRQLFAVSSAVAVAYFYACDILFALYLDVVCLLDFAGQLDNIDVSISRNLIWKVL